MSFFLVWGSYVLYSGSNSILKNRIINFLYIDGFIPIYLQEFYFILLGLILIVSVILIWKNKTHFVPRILLTGVFLINSTAIPQFINTIMSFEFSGRLIREISDQVIDNKELEVMSFEKMVLFSLEEINRPEDQFSAIGINPVNISFQLFNEQQIKNQPYRIFMLLETQNSGTFAIIRDLNQVPQEQVISEFSFDDLDYQLIKVR